MRLLPVLVIVLIGLQVLGIFLFLFVDSDLSNIQSNSLLSASGVTQQRNELFYTRRHHHPHVKGRERLSDLQADLQTFHSFLHPPSSSPSTTSFIPFISIIIPSYNYGEVILEALESVLQQEYPLDRLEVLIVDDCSTDKATLRALEKIETLHSSTEETEEGEAKAEDEEGEEERRRARREERGHERQSRVDNGSEKKTDTRTWTRTWTKAGHQIKRVRVIRSSENRGLSATRNLGWKESKGDFILFLDNDDLLDPPHSLLLLALSLELHPEVSFVFPDQWFFGNTSVIWEPQEFNAYDLLWSNHPSVCSLIRRSVLERVGGYNTTMNLGAEDWAFWLSLNSLGYRGLRVPLPLFKYRREKETMSDRMVDKMQAIREQLVENTPSLFSSPSRIEELKKLERPLISVVIPSYNCRQDYFLQTLHSLSNQTTQDFEVVIVDDGSTSPEALNFLKSLEQSSSLLIPRIIRQEHANVSNARNKGAVLAKGDFLFFLDCDDFLAPSALESLALKLLFLPSKLNSKVSFVYSGVVHFGDVNATVYSEWNKELLKFENYLTVTSLLRRQRFLEIGGFDEDYDVFEDWDLWLRFSSLGNEGRLLEEPLFHYRRHSEGRTHVNNKYSYSEMLKSLRDRNPLLFGDPIKRTLTQFQPLSIPPPSPPPLPPTSSLEGQKQTQQQKQLQGQTSPSFVPSSFPSSEVLESLEELVAGFRQFYYQVLPQQRDSYRRHNFFNFFPSKHWETEAKVGGTEEMVKKKRLSQTIHVLYLIPNIGLGGAEMVDLSILEGMKKNGSYWVTLLVESKNIQETWVSRFEETSNEIFYLSHLLENPSSEWTKEDWKDRDRATELLLDYLLFSRSVDIVFNRNTFVGYKMFKHWSETTRNDNENAKDLIHLYEPGFGAWERESYPYHPLIHQRFVISDDLRQYISSHYPGCPPSDFTIIPPGVSSYSFGPSGKLWSQLPSPFSSSSSSSSWYDIVGFVGRFTGQKEPLLWLHTAELIQQQCVETGRKVVFVMIGAGELGGEINSFIRNSKILKNNTFVFTQSLEVGELIRDFTLLMMTSSFEGIPLVILEAMGAGVPSVVTDVGAIREAISDKEGLLISAPPFLEALINATNKKHKTADLESPEIQKLSEGIAEGVLRLLKEGPFERKQRKQRNRERFDSLFTKERMQNSYLQEFEKLFHELPPRKERLAYYETRLMEGRSLDLQFLLDKEEKGGGRRRREVGRRTDYQLPPKLHHLPSFIFDLNIELYGFHFALVIKDNKKEEQVELSLSDSLEPGELVRLTLIWRASSDFEMVSKHMKYLVFVHFLDFHNSFVANSDTYPLVNGEVIHTNEWKNNEVIQQTHSFRIPEIPAGSYKLTLGLAQQVHEKWVHSELVSLDLPSLILPDHVTLGYLQVSSPLAFTSERKAEGEGVVGGLSSSSSSPKTTSHSIIWINPRLVLSSVLHPSPWIRKKLNTLVLFLQCLETTRKKATDKGGDKGEENQLLVVVSIRDQSDTPVFETSSLLSSFGIPFTSRHLCSSASQEFFHQVVLSPPPESIISGRLYSVYVSLQQVNMRTKGVVTVPLERRRTSVEKLFDFKYIEEEKED